MGVPILSGDSGRAWHLGRPDYSLYDSFYVIFGMDWFSLYHVMLDCHANTVTLVIPNVRRLEWKGTLAYFLRGYNLCGPVG